MMKRIVSTIATVLMCALLVFSVAGCNGGDKPHNEITDLYDQGYDNNSSTWYDGLWAGIFVLEDSWDTVYFAKGNITSKLVDELEALEWDDPKYDQKKISILSQLTDVEVKDITDMLPDDAELASYIGKTFGELEELGFEKSGYIGDPGTGYKFFYDGLIYSLTVTPVNAMAITDLDDYSENDLRKLVIESVEFTGISNYLLDTLLED